jgi:hypothetical protein
VLAYSEIPFDPYHPDMIESFMAGQPIGNRKYEIRSYSVFFPDFRLAYAGREAKEFTDSWTFQDQFPVEVLLKWKGADSPSHFMVCMVNAPFSVQVQGAPVTGGLAK